MFYGDFGSVLPVIEDTESVASCGARLGTPAGWQSRQRTVWILCLLVRERNDRVQQGLRRLRALDEQTLRAFYVDGCSLLEMSEQFASPVGTIKRRLHVARKRLAKELEALGSG